MTGSGRDAPEPADGTGFLLLPLAALVFSSAVLLAVVFGLTLIVPSGCGLGDVFAYPCSEMLVRMSNFFNLLAVPGALVFAWQTRLHRRRTRPLDPGVFRAAERVVAEVLASVRLPRETPVVLGPRLGRRAFTGGTDRKPYVALGPELLVLPAKGPAGRAVFEAVLRHELAHVRNHDLLRLRFATVLRISTRATALATALLLLAELAWAGRPPTVGTVAGIVLRAAVVALAAELVVRAFLRIREQQADLRAAEGDPAAIRTALHGGRERPRGLRERLLSRHPSVAHRLAGLDDDTATLTFPLGQVFAGGVFATVALTNAQLLVDLLYDAEVLSPASDGGVSGTALAVLALPAIPVALFLVDGCWRDVRGRRRTGRPARPWLLGVVFGLGALGGTYLAPYIPLVHGSRGGEVPALPGLVVFGVATGLFCWWLAALFGRAAPTRPAHRRLLLLPALPVGAGALLLAWQVGLRLLGRTYVCDHHLVSDCGPMDTVRVASGAFAAPWVAAVLALAVLAPLAVTLRRATRPALVAAAGATVAGCLLALTLPRAPIADALAPDWWARLDPRLGTPAPVLALQVALLLAVPLAALLPRASAGPLAGAGALLVLAAGLDAHLAQAAGRPVPVGPDEIPFTVGLFLGTELGVVLLAVAVTLAGRTLAGRWRGGPAGGTGGGRGVPAARTPREAGQLADEVG